MNPPTFVRPLTEPERAALHAGLRSADAFTLRRSQILLASAEGRRASQIAAALSCSTPTVGNAVASFEGRGLGCLAPRSRRPKSAQPALVGEKAERLRALVHRGPRDFGKPTSIWTLGLAAEVAHAQGITDRPMSDETIRQALIRLGIGWKRAKTWITSPDPA